MKIVLSCALALLFLSGCLTSEKNEEVLPSRSPASPSESVLSNPRGIRVDPAYFYNSHSGQTPEQIATDVMSTLKNTGANTVYVYAYNSVYGAFYPTSYPFTDVENGYGIQNIFGALTREAVKNNLRVVAVVPLNNFKKLWQQKPTWRVKQAGGVDYMPAADTHLLSASVEDFHSWHSGFIADLIMRHPDIHGVEAVEPTLDYTWSGAPDQNPAALNLFQQRYPSSTVGSTDWRNFRADEFLNLIAAFNKSVHALGKKTYLVQTWTAQSDGALLGNDTLRHNSGFDFIGVSKLSGLAKTDYLTIELIWQQWFSEFGNPVFSPDWISMVAPELDSIMTGAGALSQLTLHVEISEFSGGFNTVVPDLSEFGRTVEATKALGYGISVYDYEQMRKRGAWGVVGF